MLAWLEAPAACHWEFVKTSHLKFSNIEESQDVVIYSKVDECVIMA